MQVSISGHYLPDLVNAFKGVVSYVPLSHLGSKGTASAYITYCTGSGMLTRYTHNIKVLYW